MIIKLKLGVSGVFSVFLQHYMGCVFYGYTACFFNEKKTNYCQIQVSSLRRSPVCLRYITVASLRSPPYSAQATRLRHAIAALAPLPAHSVAQITCSMTHSNHLLLHLPGKWVWTIFARYVIAARQMDPPLLNVKPDSLKESGIYVAYYDICHSVFLVR